MSSSSLSSPRSPPSVLEYPPRLLSSRHPCLLQFIDVLGSLRLAPPKCLYFVLQSDSVHHSETLFPSCLLERLSEYCEVCFKPAKPLPHEESLLISSCLIFSCSSYVDESADLRYTSSSFIRSRLSSYVFSELIAL